MSRESTGRGSGEREVRRAKKSLGQHFLTSQPAIKKTVEAAGVKEGDTVLEVGPGTGALTKALLDAGAHVIAVEKDETLASELEEQLAEAVGRRALTVVAGDILEIDRATLGLSEGAYKVVANIPYYLTGRIIRLLLSEEPRPSVMALIIQKEVAERIVARKHPRSSGGKKPFDSAQGKESLLSISTKAYGDPRYVATIKRGSFSPPPEVDSAIVAIENISAERLKNVDVERFFEILKAGFGQKRKQLRGNLAPLADSERLAGAFERVSIPKNARAEDLSVKQWLTLATELCE